MERRNGDHVHINFDFCENIDFGIPLTQKAFLENAYLNARPWHD